MTNAVHWSDLAVTDSDSNEITGAARTKALRELRAHDSMADCFLARTGAAHEDPDDASTWGPLASEIDWAGFDDVTDEQISALRYEADVAGDVAMATIANRALGGHSDARAECARVIREAAAQGDA